jgi:ADP-dependent NAD(P)H-hydrate dehydratase / NAD(P)H-hydrate epimerase
MSTQCLRVFTLGHLFFERVSNVMSNGPAAKKSHDIWMRRSHLQQVIVTAQQMQAIESRIFASGMPVAALMEKVGGRIAQQIESLYPCDQYPCIGILVGPGHNGGDALVVARELSFKGYSVSVHRPLAKAKPLTQQHFQYLQSLKIPVLEQGADLLTQDVIIDGLFGFGLERPIDGELKALLEHINAGSTPVVSIDLPSGLHTDTGQVLGIAIKATQTLCLGLWKLGLLQDSALDCVGQLKLIDFDIPVADIDAVLRSVLAPKRLTPQLALSQLPLHRPQETHKYRQGHLLLMGGSQRYPGSILLAARGARATGIGMLSIAVPQSLKALVVAQIPEALVMACPETEDGAIAQLPPDLSLERFDAIAYGPGITTAETAVLPTILASPCPLILDADGLNLLAQSDVNWHHRRAKLILTPHPGEFKRLFPELATAPLTKAEMAQQAAQGTGAVILLKGARTAIATPDGDVLINPESTPALARGGSGDVLTGLVGGLYAQTSEPKSVAAAAWWHAQAGLFTVQSTTEMGVDPVTLSEQLLPALQAILQAGASGQNLG